MEPEDLPWPSELEEEEVEVEEVEEAEEEPEAGSLGEDEVVTVEDVEEQGLELGADCGCEAPPRECTDDEDDEEAKAWLEAQPSGTLTAPTLPRHRYLAGERPGPERVVPLTHHVWQQDNSVCQDNSGMQIFDTNVVRLEKKAQWGYRGDQRTESWDCLPQEMDSSQTLTTPKTRFNVREEETKVTDFPSLEEGVLTQSENHVKESNRDLLCSPLLVIQDNFASPDLPLLTCVTRDLEFGPDSLFQQSEVDFAPLRRIPGKSEDTEWFSRPSEVSEALFQAASKVASDLVNNCFSVSQHPHTGSTTVGSQYSFLPPEQGSKEETISSETVDELKTPKDSDSYDALCSYMSWKTQEVIQEPETNLGDKDQVSISTSTDVSDEYIIPKGSEHFGASCSYVQYWNRKTLQQSEKYLTRKDHDSFSDSSDTIDKNKIPKGNDSFSAPFSYMPCSKQGASHYPKICPISMDYVSFPHEVAPHFKNEISCSFLHCLLGRRGKEFPLMSGSHCFESVYLGASAENKVKQKMDSLEGYERNEEGLGKELPQYFDLKEDRNTLEFSEVHPRSSKIQYIENIVPDNSVKVSKVRDTFNIETSGGPLQTVKSNLDETSEQLYFQEERNQKATFAFGGGNVDASENIAFEAVIASIEPSKKERVRNEIQTDITKSLTNDSQESEPEISDLSLLSYDENFFFDSHPCYQSTPGVFEQAASRPLLHKKDGDDSSLYWHPNLKSPPINSQEIFINPFSVTPELKSSLSEKALGLGKMQSPLFQCDTNNEPFLPIGKIKSVSALDLAVKVGSSNIFFPVKVSTSDSLVSQDFKELTDFSNCTLGKNVNSNNITEGPPSAIGSSFSANLVSCDVESQGALPLTSDASLIAVGQEILLKADIGQGEIPQPMGAKCSFTIHTIMQNDSYFIEGLQGKAESDICTLDDDIESCSLDENAVVCSERVAELQREICDQGDLTSECIELAGLENVLDQDIGRSSLHWKSPLKLPSKEEGSFEEPVDHSNVDIKQPFPSILPSFVPHESVRELNYHPADLRMLRVSPDTVPKTPKHLTAWNLKFNLAREYECGYSISELNEDDRRKVEEIKAKLFAHERTTALSKGLRSPQGIGCKPGAVCSHIIIESHEKGCFRTLTAEQPQLDTHPCVFRSAEPSEMIRGQRSPSSWRSRHINLCKSLDQNNPHFKVWNSLQFQSHSPFENFTADDFNISKGLQMPFHEKMDPWLSELVDPACVLPSEEMECHFPSRSSSQMPPPESMKKFTTSITFSSHRHSKCISDSSVFKVGVTEGSQCTGASMGVFNSHFTEEQNIPRDLKQRTCSPSSFKTLGHSPDKTVTILAESSRQNQKLPVELSHQEEKLLERSHFKGSHFEPSTHADSHNFKEVHFSDNNTPINLDRPSSTPSIKEKNITITPDLPSHIFLEQRELFEQCKFPPTDHHVGKHSPPPQHQDYLAPNLPCHIFLEKRDFFEQAPHVEHQMKENESPIPQGQDSIASGTPCSIFLEQRKLFEQSKAPNKDYHIRKHPSSLPQDEDCVVEKKNQHKHKSHISNMINVEPSSNNVVSQPTSNQYTVVTSTSTPPSNRKAISCVRITLGPKTPSKLDSGTLDKTFQSLDPASKTRMNSEFNSDLQTISSRSLEPTSKLLTSKTIAQDQEFLGPKSSPDLEVVQSPLPDNYIQDLKIIPSENSQLVTSRQTQVNNSDLERYSNPEGTPVSADRPSEEIKTPFSTFSGKLLSDAVTQITTESPDKTLLSSEIFINDTDLAHAIPEPKTQKMLSKVPIKLASSSSIQQISVSRGPDAQPSLLPYKPSGDTKMYYVPQLSQIPPSLDSKSDTTIESSHSGSNDAVAPDFPAQVLGTRDDDLAVTVNIKHKEGIYSKRAVSKAALSVRKNPFQKDNTDAEVQVIFTKDERLLDKNGEEEIHSNWAVTVGARSEEKESLQKDTAGSSDAAATGSSAQLPDTKIENLPDTEEIKQIEEVQSKRPVTKEAWSENKESLQIDIAGSGFENTTHSVFRSAKFYFHHPVHLSNDQDFFHESLGRSVFMKHSWKDFFQHHPDKYREHTYPPPPFQNAEKSKADYPKIESLSINVNLENKEAVNDQTREYPKVDQKINDPKRYHKVTPEQTTQHTASLNELWNKYQERQSQQKPSEFTDKKELSLVERLDRLAKLLQNPITHSLQAVESTQDDSKGEQDVKEWSGKQQQQKNKLQKKKRYKSIEKCHKNTGDLKKNKVFPAHQMGRSNQIKIEQIKFDKYILRKQPGCHYINNTSSDSRPSEESDLLTDTPTNILSPTTSVDSDILTQTDKEVTYERSSSISTIDTARLIQAFGHERVCLSPRQIKLYSSITDHQRRYLEKRSRNKRALNIGHPQMTSEHTRRKHIQVSNHVISSDSISSPTSSFWSLSSTFCNKKNVQMLNKGVQAGNLEIVNGVKKHTRDVGMTFPTPGSREARVEEDSDVTSWLEDKIEEKMFLTNYLGDRKSRKNKQRCCEGVSWFVPVENVKSGSKKENLPKFYGPGISWFAPITSTKPWREPLREQNWQEQCMDSHRPLAGPGRDPPMPFVRATLQESLWLHRPDFISRSGERIKRLKLIVQERKLQNMLQSEREALFNTVREWQGYRDPMNPLSKRGFLAAQKNRPVGKKEMIQRSKRIYEQLPEVQKKREEEKRRSEYKSYRLRAQLYKKKVTNQLLGRKVPWD
ncbi:centrosome-associated protein ALMS1 isoform X7 [Talpa occidentalis]|uniref:centrosome-associated protein ALMS1 isoform X7 n=1 Tax=Talpa occidentalis TaxID=50954 RepID=UPI0023F72C50|nr:centrosome-associated protein ALMS1 isoform X7 [Talpa occidentalis]